MDNFYELIKKAEEGSKQDFIRFVKHIYNVDEHIFDHMWEVPVIAPYEGDCVITAPLSTKSEDELLDIIDNLIAEELGDADGCFIYLDKMESELSKEEIEEIFIEYVKGVITHERCHLNANYYITEVRDSERVYDYVNGASLNTLEQDDIIDDESRDTSIINKYNFERNEVLIDTLRQMMNNYQEGDTIEDCLYKIIEKRKGKNQYNDFDDTEVLAMYVIFPEELTEWATFGAYEFIRENKLKEKIIEVCGTDEPLSKTKLIKEIEAYTSSLENGKLSEKQIKMLEMLGINKKINKEEMKMVATSKSAFGSLEGTLVDVKRYIENLQNKDNSKEK